MTEISRGLPLTDELDDDLDSRLSVSTTKSTPSAWMTIEPTTAPATVPRVGRWSQSVRRMDVVVHLIQVGCGV